MFDTHLFSLLQLMKKILYPQTFDQKQDQKLKSKDKKYLTNTKEQYKTIEKMIKSRYEYIILEENKRNDLITFDLSSFIYEKKTVEQYLFIKNQIQKSNFFFLYKYLQLILSSLINSFQANQQQQKDKDTSCDEPSFLSSILQKYNEHSIECKMDFTLNAPQILTLMNSYSNKIILMDLRKLQMNTDSNLQEDTSIYEKFGLIFKDNKLRNKTDQHLSTGCLQLSGLSIRGLAMLSQEGLPHERETLEYAWQMEIILAPIRLCMCNMHTSLCNESLTLKVDTIQIRQLLRLYPGSWLEAGSISVPELRINAKFECHPPTPTTINEQLELLRRHDQHSQRLHFLYNFKSQ
ncbi:unnamed protein product [Adineta steineri]|uniref:Uncharacterized protein n=1 Tax=Adineta steineri TaxID=433720 RepID=A0A814TKN8_9BILA|nr:unnamed protein product [Adineta steineri]CAF1162731.1 unnamed protein product [Adineta steineri]